MRQGVIGLGLVALLLALAQPAGTRAGAGPAIRGHARPGSPLAPLAAPAPAAGTLDDWVTP